MKCKCRRMTWPTNDRPYGSIRKKFLLEEEELRKTAAGIFDDYIHFCTRRSTTTWLKKYTRTAGLEGVGFFPKWGGGKCPPETAAVSDSVSGSCWRRSSWPWSSLLTSLFLLKVRLNDIFNSSRWTTHIYRTYPHNIISCTALPPSLIVGQCP